MKERVFIAWGGNQSLARLVCSGIDHSDYEGIVGGGAVEQLYVGSQVFSQIKKATRAIILVKSNMNNEGKQNLNDNLMFEWGYLVAKLPPEKIHVFLIDMNTRDLPSDLAGAWAQEIKTGGRAESEIASEIVGIFCDNSKNRRREDKLTVLHNYNVVKEYMLEHNTSPRCSDGDLAYYIFTCIEVAYYLMDEENFKSALYELQPSTNALDVIAMIAKANMTLFEKSRNLQSALTFDDFFELKTFFKPDFDISMQDEELDLWAKMYCTNRQGICHYLVAKSDDLADADKPFYIKKAIEYQLDAINQLEAILVRYPGNAEFAQLYLGYFYHDIFLCYQLLNDSEEAKKHIDIAVVPREKLFKAYKRRFPEDTVMNSRFSQEYYIALAEQLRFSNDPVEKKAITRTIESYLAKMEDQTQRQHSLIERLKALIPD